jgi:RecA-family ATPase
VNVHLKQPSGNLTPLAILKIATTAWREQGFSNDTLQRLTLKHEDAVRHQLPADKVPAYLADMLVAEPTFVMSPVAQALLDVTADPDDALLATDDAPATAPQEPEAKSEPPRSPLHKAARDYAVRGIPVFPCSPGTKKPFPGSSGFKEATRDLAAIDAWWMQTPDANIATCPEDSGHCVVEQDPGGDVAPLNLPFTRRVKSPRGGVHYWFKGSLPASASKLAPHVDTRGRGSYVLLPPSIVNDVEYVWLDEREAAELPAHIATALETKAEAMASSVDQLDLHGNVVAARSLLRDYVRQGKVAIAGKGGDNFTYKVACQLVRDYALSVDKALELMEAEFNPHCVPPWSREELIAKIHHAAAYGQNEPGAYASAPAAEVFKAADVRKIMGEAKSEEPLGDAPDPEPRKEWSGPDPLSAKELSSRNFPPTTFLTEGIVLARHVNLLYGDGGVGKTLLAEQIAIAQARGLPLFGHKTIQIPAFLVLGEDDSGQTKERLKKLAPHYGCDLADLPLDTWCLPGFEIALARVSDVGEVALYPFFERLQKELSKRRGHFVVLDALADLADLNENVRGAVNKFLKQVLPPLCRDYDATIMALGHASKSSMESGSFYSGTTAWNAAVRQRLVLEAPGDNEMERRTTNRRLFHVAKPNYGEAKTIELFMMGKPPIFVDTSNVDVAEGENLDREAIMATVTKMLKQGIKIVRSTGNGQKPDDVAAQVKKDFGRIVTKKQVLQVLSSAEREGRLGYRDSRGGGHGSAGFFIPDNPFVASTKGDGEN